MSHKCDPKGNNGDHDTGCNNTARTSLGPWKFVLDMVSFESLWVNHTPGPESNMNNLGMSFRSSLNNCMMTVYTLESSR